jgi:hypothetical protein
LLVLAAMPVQRVEQHRISPRKLVGLAQILPPPFERLFVNHGSPIAFHRGIVGSKQLRRHHTLELVFRSDPG